MTSPLAVQVVEGFSSAGLTLATAESLTGGLVAAAVTDVPGSAAVLTGGIVAYATGVKAALLGVDAALLEREGAVHPEVALQMAEGAARVLAADVGVATTGVAGPDGQDGVEPGVVFVAVVGAGARTVRRLDLAGDREQIRSQTVAQALRLLIESVG